MKLNKVDRKKQNKVDRRKLKSNSDILNAQLIEKNVLPEEDFNFQCLQILQKHQFKKLNVSCSDPSGKHCILTGYDCKMKKNVIIQLANDEIQKRIKPDIFTLQAIKKHKCVAEFQRFALDEDGNILFTAWEHNNYCQDLLSLVKSPYFNVEEIERVSRNIYAGISFLHSQGITHGAIRPEAIVRDSDGWVKVACFDIFNRNELLEDKQSIEKEKSQNDCPLFISKKKADLGNALKVMKYLWDECEKSLLDSNEILQYQKSRMMDIFASIADLNTATDIAQRLGWNENIQSEKRKFFSLQTTEYCLIDGKKSGKERCSYWQNQIIYKDWKDGEIQHGVIYYQQGDIYSGGIVNNLPEGYGEIMWKKTGGKYTGMFKKNKMEGEGICINEGTMIKGNYKNNCVEGFGMTSPGNGDLYVGNFKHHKKHGKGNYFWKSQGPQHDVYEGMWKNDQMHGKGVIKYKDGNIYEGDMKNGKMEGFGTLFNPTGDIYQGEWKNSQYCGQGEMYISWNKETYKGEFKDSLRHGKGTLTDENGIVTVDYWKNGVISNDQEPNFLSRILEKANSIASCNIF